MTISRTDVTKASKHVEETIGLPNAWPEWQGGWPGEISTALIDAVYSARATYYNWHGTGIWGQVAGWRMSPKRKRLHLEDLVTEMTPSMNKWMVIYGFDGASPGRSRRAAFGHSKAAAVREAAEALIGAGISTAGDINAANVADVRRILRSISGIGRETVNRFLLLLGAPGTEADGVTARFFARGVGRSLSKTEADVLVTKIAGRLSVEPHALNRAIWAYESLRARSWKSLRIIGVDTATVAFGSASALGKNFSLNVAKLGGTPPPIETLVCLDTKEDCPLPVEVLRLPDGTPYAARMCCVSEGDVLEGEWHRIGELVLADGKCLACDPWCSPNPMYVFEFKVTPGRYLAETFISDGEQMGLRIRLVSSPGG